MVFHLDGAEFYANSEYLVWSMGSALASGDVPQWQRVSSIRLSRASLIFNAFIPGVGHQVPLGHRSARSRSRQEGACGPVFKGS